MSEGTCSCNAPLPISFRRFPNLRPDRNIYVASLFVERRLVNNCRITDPLSDLSIWHTHPAGWKSAHALRQFSQR
jgi:hypothetical protein